MFSLPPITQALIVTNCAVFFLDSSSGGMIGLWFALWPFGPYFLPWQLLTYAFVHGGVLHLAFNMFGLYMFGSDVERVWGPRRYLTFYLVCAVCAGVMQFIVTALSGGYYPTVGASGALFGLLLAFARCFPYRVVIPVFPPIPMRAPVFVTIFGIVELVFGVTGTQAGVAHFAHLGGLAGAYLFMRFQRIEDSFRG
jgi:membrane associated rhomboid family serine protease